MSWAGRGRSREGTLDKGPGSLEGLAALGSLGCSDSGITQHRDVGGSPVGRPRAQGGLAPGMERTLLGPRGRSRQQPPWGSPVQTSPLESTTRPPSVFGLEGHRTTEPFGAIATARGHTRGSGGPKSRAQQVAEEGCASKPRTARLRIFLLQQSFPNFRHPGATVVTIIIYTKIGRAHV